MECSEDGALRAKKMAEKRFLQDNFGVAKLLATKARALNPNIDGISELMATIDVYIASEKRVGADVNWYEVLGAQPLDDDETIRKCYRQMALTLHPDKNKSVGADGAFKLVSQAWTVLSDKTKRAAFDQKCRLWESFKRITGGIPQNSLFDTINLGGKPSEPASRGGLFNAANRKDRDLTSGAHANPTPRPSVSARYSGLFSSDTGKDIDHMSAAHTNPTPNIPLDKQPSFWTVCSFCRTHYEYFTVYKNCNIVCAGCKKPFFASETPPPPLIANASPTLRAALLKQHKFNSTGLVRNNHVSSRTLTSAGNSSGPTSVSTASGALGHFNRPSVNLKRRHEDLTPLMSEEAHLGKTHVERTVAGSDFQPSWKKICTGERKVDSDRQGMEAEMASKKGISSTNVSGSLKNSFDAGKVSAAGNSRRNGIRDMSQQNMRSILAEKARKVICKKLDEWKEGHRKLDEWKAIRKTLDERYPSSTLKNTGAEVKVKEKEKAIINGVKPGPKEIVDSKTTNNNSISADSEVPLSVTMSVPDPDFHDFDGDRVEDTFGENQVWAAYDDEDGMPRYYAFIHSVISKNPFQMKITWLSSKTNDEFAPIKWVGSGFPKTTGDLRLGKRVISSTLNSFSHRVKWTKGPKGIFRIYPKKGDVWALYQNWSPDWDELTKDNVIHQYEMVEVLDDYSEEHGLNVAPLSKVAGFKTVFRQNADSRKIRNIPREEMFRFSHQVPSYLLTGEEGENAPKGLLELDPASTPMELLQLITDPPTQEMEEMMPVEKSSKDDLKHKDNSGTGKKAAGAQAGKVWPENLLVYKRKRFKVKKDQ
ncbi:uncharacterized protein LOC127078366 [Lathyrus oleraceus]|uniref:J domain-containing protein n=1 Tax=Pisum sativum TaxID=3888 RepID=A0A9D4WNE1_PEA|nr:uncharacterized protein LOC127078366 [Pisum sativum]KAI5404658.1 hypothetical protein KIW84_051713 [Pisum sativum]